MKIRNVLILSLISSQFLIAEIDLGEGGTVVASAEEDYKEIRDNAPDTQEDKESGLYDARTYYKELRDLPLNLVNEHKCCV